MSSVHDMIPWARHVNYAASKGRALMFIKSIAQELAPLKIRVNAISPGAIKTSINKEAWGTEANLKSLMELIPYKRTGHPKILGEPPHGWYQMMPTTLPEKRSILTAAWCSILNLPITADI